MATAVMTMSKFPAAPREGHLKCVKRTIGCLVKMKHGVIGFRVEEPDLFDVSVPKCDWMNTVCGDVSEQVLQDAPRPKTNFATFVICVDANLCHDFTLGKSVTGTFHLHKTPIDCHSEKQSMVKTATHSLEFVAAKTAVEQVMDLRTTLCHLGVLVREALCVFDDNESVVTGSTIPNHTSKNNTQHQCATVHTKGLQLAHSSLFMCQAR